MNGFKQELEIGTYFYEAISLLRMSFALLFPLLEFHRLLTVVNKKTISFLFVCFYLFHFIEIILTTRECLNQIIQSIPKMSRA